MEALLKDVLSDIVGIDNILLIVRTGGAISEMRGDSLTVRQKDNWITIGDSDGPCHMHIDAGTITSAKFVRENKESRVSYSVRFFGKGGEKMLSAVFSKMYDDDRNIRPDRVSLYDRIFQKYGSNETITFQT